MLLGTILADLRDEGQASTALAAFDDLVLLAEVQRRAAQYSETPGEYAAGAVSRFATSASNEEWLALMTAIGKSADPARTTLDQTIRWSLAEDAKAEAPVACCGGTSCGCTEN